MLAITIDENFDVHVSLKSDVSSSMSLFRFTMSLSILKALRSPAVEKLLSLFKVFSTYLITGHHLSLFLFEYNL